jgi:hypothetical protein
MQNMADRAVSSGFTRIYTHALGRRLSQNFAKCKSLFANLEGFDVEKGCKASTIRSLLKTPTPEEDDLTGPSLTK